MTESLLKYTNNPKANCWIFFQGWLLNASKNLVSYLAVFWWISALALAIQTKKLNIIGGYYKENMLKWGEVIGIL